MAGGNRFGSNFGGGGNSLHRRQVELMLESALRKKNSGGRNIQGGGGPMQPQPGTYGNPMMMSSSPASAAESGAFNERNKNRALYGRSGFKNFKNVYKGGIVREQLQQKTREDAVESARKQGEFQIKKDTLAEKKRANRAKEADPLGMGAKPQTKVKTGGGAPVTAQPAVRPQPVAQPAQPQSGYASATDPDGNVTRVDANGRMTRTQAVGNAPIQQPPPVISPQAPMPVAAPQQTPAQVAIQQAQAQGGVVQQPPVPETAAGAAWQTAKDMTYNAPVQAIGQKNINAFGNTLADMFYRKPLKALKGGLSRQVFGGIR